MVHRSPFLDYSCSIRAPQQEFVTPSLQQSVLVVFLGQITFAEHVVRLSSISFSLSVLREVAAL